MEPTTVRPVEGGSEATTRTGKRATAAGIPVERALWEAAQHATTSATTLVLRYLISATDASAAVLYQKTSRHRRRLVGLRRDGTRIGRPDRVLTSAMIDAAFAGTISSENTAGESSLALPLPTKPGERALLYLEAPAIGADRGSTEDRERWAHYTAIAMEIDRLKLGRAQPASASASDPPAPGANSVLELEASSNLVPEIIGESPAVAGIQKSILLLSRSDLPVLIEGESGTGKELVARAIHRLSRRRAHPFVSQNCGAVPSHLIESEFFGHERGAFTGAEESRPGIFEQAEGGTVFLDEVGEMDFDVQKRLLRVLQNREVRRVGGRETRTINFRVVSATNRDLEREVAAGRFREDLYYRLNVATIRVPALRERRADVPLLVRHFGEEFAREAGRPPLEYTSAAIESLTNYSWPGNIRELQNEIRVLSSTVSGTADEHALSPRVRTARPPLRRPASSGGATSTLPSTLFEVERATLAPVIEQTIREADGNRSEAARRLGIDRSELYRRMRRYGIMRLKARR